MTDGQKQRVDLSAFVGKLLAEEYGDVLREGVRVLAQALMEVEVTELARAERHERNDEWTGYRNGSRPRVWDTGVGTIELAVPKVRPGSYYPSLLQPRRRAEQALRAVPTSTGCRRGRWTSWSRPWGWTGSRSRRCRGCVRNSTRWSSRFARGN